MRMNAKIACEIQKYSFPDCCFNCIKVPVPLYRWQPFCAQVLFLAPTCIGGARINTPHPIPPSSASKGSCTLVGVHQLNVPKWLPLIFYSIISFPNPLLGNTFVRSEQAFAFSQTLHQQDATKGGRGLDLDAMKTQFHSRLYSEM